MRGHRRSAWCWLAYSGEVNGAEGGSRDDRPSVGLVPHFEDLRGTAAQRRSAVDAAVRAGVPHLAVVDHVSFRNGWGMDGLLQASAILALDHGLAVDVGAFLLALRTPLVVARQVADLAAAAPGRISLAAGIGGEDRREVSNSGTDPATRGLRTDESLRALRALLDGQTVTTAGRFVTLDEAVIRPAPDPPVPIVVAGRSDAALRRAGELGDGWLALWTSPGRFAHATAEVERTGAALGRGVVRWRHGLTVWCGFGDDEAAGRARLDDALVTTYGMDPARVARWCPCGPPAAVADALRPYVDVGCRRFNVIGRAGSTREVADAVGEVGRLLCAASVSPSRGR